MELFVLLAEEGHGGAGMVSPTDLLNPTNHAAALWALGIFVVLLVVLKKMAWGPIVAGLDAREQRIAESLSKAEEIEKATRELAETNRAELEKAQREAAAIVAASRESAKTQAEEIVAKAHADITAEKDRFKRELELETRKAQAILRQDAVDLTIDATSRLIGRTLSSSDERRLVEDALKDAESVARN